MISSAQNYTEINHFSQKEISAGSNAELECNSNDYNHNFVFWYFGNNVIGPGNQYDDTKYKYEILSGKLRIKNVSPEESGAYTCVSKKISGTGFNIGQVQMIVKGSTFSTGDIIRLVAIVLSIIVIITCAVLYYKLRKEWKKYDQHKVIPVDEVNEEERDEVYNRTTAPFTEPVAGPSRNASSDLLLYGIDNQGLDTDFNSVFENIQIKTIH